MAWDRVLMQALFSGVCSHAVADPSPRYLAIRLGERHIRPQSYVLGSLLGPVLILGFGLLSYQDVAHGLSGDGTL